MKNEERLADEAAVLIHSGWDFHSAVREVLEQDGITERWDYFFSTIGKILSNRRKRKPAAKPNLLQRRKEYWWEKY